MCDHSDSRGRYRDEILAAIDNPDDVHDVVAQVLRDGNIFDIVMCFALPGVDVEPLVKAAFDDSPLSDRNTARMIIVFSRVPTFPAKAAERMTKAMLDVEGAWKEDLLTEATLPYMLNTFKIEPDFFGIGFDAEAFTQALAHDDSLTMSDLLVLDSACKGELCGFTRALAKHIEHHPVDEIRGFLLNRGHHFIGTEVRPLLEKLIAEGGWRDVILAANLYGLVTNRSPALELIRRGDVPAEAWVEYYHVLARSNNIPVLSDVVTRERFAIAHGLLNCAESNSEIFAEIDRNTELSDNERVWLVDVVRQRT
ncbi:hypothetical protein [Marinobacterium sp. BA1]|uniref:hypothetical protein n=1 Tax=Marinobacterium sp. BA1 TaxID=3138931 RepID=UPI0032E7C627